MTHPSLQVHSVTQFIALSPPCFLISEFRRHLICVPFLSFEPDGEVLTNGLVTGAEFHYCCLCRTCCHHVPNGRRFLIVTVQEEIH
jgi:hypothetical protein